MPQLHAIIPAAGHSRRMGQQKLLMQIQGVSIIKRLIDGLRAANLDTIDVLIRPEDALLRQEVIEAGATAVNARNPPEMLESVQQLLQYLDEVRHPQTDAGWLLIPADHPMIEVPVLEHLIAVWKKSPRNIVVPTHQGRRGHPTIFPWGMYTELNSIPENQGLNWLVRHSTTQVLEIDCPETSILWDVDTPEDLQAMIERLEPNS